MAKDFDPRRILRKISNSLSLATGAFQMLSRPPTGR